MLVYVEHCTLFGESLIWQILCQPLVYNFSRCLHKFLESGQNAACEMYNKHLDIAIRPGSQQSHVMVDWPHQQ